jgi:fructokinase
VNSVDSVAGPVVVVCGEALIDLTHGANDEPMHYVGHEGGGPCNTAVALGRLGTPTGFLGRLGVDRFAQALRAHMSASLVDLRYVQETSDPSMLAVATIGQEGNAEYAFYLTGTADVGLTVASLPQLDDTVRVLHFGTLALALEPVGTALCALAAQEKGRRVIALDPNVRLVAIADVDSYRTRIESMVALADVVKISDADLAGLWPTADVDHQAATLFASGPALLCVTRGGDGVTVFHGASRFDVPATRVEVIDTIGAGDTFNAALLHHLVTAGADSREAVLALSEDQVREAVAFAVRAAAVTCTRAGANPPWAKEL